MFDNFDPKNIRVALLAGGKSNERPISLKSAEGAKEALEQAGYQVDQIDPADNEQLKKLVDGKYDVAFLVLHGKGGEDGTIQGFLETIGLPYTGSGIWSCATALDKTKAKFYYIKEGIPTPEALTVSLSDDYDLDDIVLKLGEKCAVKAATEGSSIGVYIVKGKEAIGQAIKDALNIDKSVLIERYVAGNEYTVAVIDTDEGPEALPIIQIIPRAESYDFDSKYAPGGSEHICPAELPEDKAKEMQEYAIRAHKCLECKGISRNDFLMDEEGGLWILESNLLPGMTATSLVPDAAKAAGIPFPELCTTLINDALNRD